MGWLASKLIDWATNKQEQELVALVTNASAADSWELGLPVTLATSYRHVTFQNTGIELVHLSLSLRAEPMICARLSREIRQMQQDKQFALVAAIEIWLHSLRATQNLKLRPHGRELWRQLSRGFPYVEECATDYRLMTGKDLDIRHFDQIPDGLGPQT